MPTTSPIASTVSMTQAMYNGDAGKDYTTLVAIRTMRAYAD
jgi:hypothetical protein